MLVLYINHQQNLIDGIYSLLEHAVSKGNAELVKLLIERGGYPMSDYSPDLSSRDKTAQSLLFKSCLYQGSPEVVEILLREEKIRAVINCIPGDFPDSGTPLHIAAKYAQFGQHFQMVKLLLQAGADPNMFDRQGKLPDQIATAPRVIKLLKDERSALLFIQVIKSKNNEQLNILLSKNVKANIARSTDGVTPLIAAAEMGRTDIVSVLLTIGADINAQDRDGMTALMYAAYNGHVETVKTLLEMGADVALRDRRKRTAYDFAKASDHPASDVKVKKEVKKTLPLSAPFRIASGLQTSLGELSNNQLKNPQASVQKKRL